MYLENLKAHALYQGDILVVPRFESDPDPHILRLEKFEKAVKCGCGESPVVKGKSWQRSATSSHIKGDPNLFVEEREVAARLSVVAALVISHSCDLDSGDAVLMAPIVAWSSLELSQQAKIEDPAKKSAYFVLEARGRMPKAAVNLERQFSISNKFLGKKGMFRAQASGRNEPLLRPYTELLASRVGTLDDKAMLGLYNKLGDQLFRAKVLELTLEGSARLLLDAARPEELPTRGFAWPLPDWFGAEPAQSSLVDQEQESTSASAPAKEATPPVEPSSK